MQLSLFKAIIKSIRGANNRSDASQDDPRSKGYLPKTFTIQKDEKGSLKSKDTSAHVLCRDKYSHWRLTESPLSQRWQVHIFYVETPLEAERWRVRTCFMSRHLHLIKEHLSPLSQPPRGLPSLAHLLTTVQEGLGKIRIFNLVCATHLLPCFCHLQVSNL